MMNFDEDEIFMRMALRQARLAADGGEVPVGAAVVRHGEVIGLAHNQVEQLADPTAHAEILAITQAANAIGDWRLTETRLYVTKEPCVMCAGAVINSRIEEVIWGVDDPRRGGAISLCAFFDNPALNHHPRYRSGILEHEARELLQSFFRKRRIKALGEGVIPPEE